MLPLPFDWGDLYANNSFEIRPISNETSTRQHQNLSTLSPYTYVPTTNDTHFVTDCPAVLGSLPLLTSDALEYERVSVSDALLAYNVSQLTASGYPNPGSSPVTYRGGDLLFMVDGAHNLFNIGPSCMVWLEQLVLVTTDTSWVAFTGHNFAVAYNHTANVRAVIDGVQLPLSSMRVRDDELFEVLLPAFLGRRRLQVDVNGVRSNGLVLVNAKPVIHGVMEWRLGVEDIRGPSPASENVLIVPSGFSGTTWGGYGAWNQTLACTAIEVIGFHFGSMQNVAAGQVIATVNGRRCTLLQDVRHHRYTCCVANGTSFPMTLQVVVGGQTSLPFSLTLPAIVRKPIVSVRSHVVVLVVFRLCCPSHLERVRRTIALKRCRVMAATS